jgi:hypothetical protein
MCVETGRVGFFRRDIPIYFDETFHLAQLFFSLSRFFYFFLSMGWTFDTPYFLMQRLASILFVSFTRLHDMTAYQDGGL